MSDYYNHAGYPAQGSSGSSSAMRAELDAIAAAFNKLPILSGNSLKIIRVNAAGTALEAVTAGSASIAASDVESTPAGGLSANTVQAALNELDSEKQPLIGTISGLAKGNGANALTAAIAGTDYLAPAAIGTDVQAYDADTAKTDVAQNFTLPQRSALLTDNDGNFDLSEKQNFKCTTAAGLTLTLANQANGLSGSVIFINGGNHAIAAHANTKLTTSDLTKLSATGTYRIDYLSDATNAYCSVVGPYA